ncbi:Phage major capsid protein E [Fulvimarina manganoxydans]|uniref:Phage major capsid protein E n=1 Tax=Fulvimarina manganoxydans TaxID=937218 RepID=A0A1W2A9Z5_9HYPH|nr:major capsid protein [Fulvimarina manganoxydans]SMC57497.1 Phage major capsid protein E [Fulvimarina manganoxydans]
MDYDPIWDHDAFTNVQMTAAMNLLPRQGQDIADHVPFTETPVYTEDFALDRTTIGEIDLIPSSDPGSPGDLMKDYERSTAHKFSMPYFTRRTTIRPSEVIGARIPGSNATRVFETERQKKQTYLRREFDATKAHQRWHALFGKIYDCNGRLLLDVLSHFQMQRLKKTITLGSSVEAIDDQVIDCMDKIERILGFTPEWYKLIVTEKGMKELRRDKVYKEIRTLNKQSTWVDRQDGRKGTIIAEKVEVVYFQSPHIDETKNLLVPMIPDLGRTINGPSASMDFEGEVLPFYSQSQPLAWNEGLEIKGSMRTISYTTRPDAAIEIDFSK